MGSTRQDGDIGGGDPDGGPDEAPTGPSPGPSRGAPWWVRRSVRLRLSPAVPRLLRGATGLQVGVGGQAQVLHGLGREDWHTLGLLARGTSREALEVDARRRGTDPERALRLVQLLAEAGAIVTDDAGQRSGTPAAATPGPTARPGSATRSRSATASGSATARRLRGESAAWAGVWPRPPAASSPVPWHARPRVAQRAERRVVVLGGGGLGSAVATCLASSGVGLVCHEDASEVQPCDVVPGGPTLDDLGEPVGRASSAALARVGCGSPAGRAVTAGGARYDGSSRPPDVVVAVRCGAADAAAAFQLVQDGVVHVPVVVREAEVVVGPVVVPGTTACLHCLDHHRCDADPGWADVLRQLLAREPARTTAVPALATLSAGLTTLLALSHLDGRPFAPAGAAAAVRLPDGGVTWQCWRPHPRCGCVALPLEAPGSARSRVPGETGSATMTA